MITRQTPLRPQHQDETVSAGGSPREVSLRLINPRRLPNAKQPFSTRPYNPLLNMHLISMENSIQFYDLAGQAKYKEHFANESYQEAFVYLFRRRAYPLLASGIYRTCRLTSKTASAVLDKLNLKSRVRRLRWD